MAEMSGNIVPYEVTVTRDNGDRSLGIGGIPVKANGQKRTQTILHTTGKRSFILPAQDGKLAGRIVNIINNASNEVYISSFLVQKSEVTDALIEASKRGIFVVLLTARESDLTLSEDDLDMLSTSRAEAITGHKQLLDDLAGNVLVRTSGDFHAKYVIADPFSAPAGLLMTSNATVDAMNGSNIELAITLLPDEVLSLFHQHVRGFWEIAGYELLEKGKLSPVRKNVVPVTYGNVTTPATYGLETGLKGRLIGLIRAAREKIIICAWTFQANHVIIGELGSAIDRGVKVEIYARFEKDRPENAVALLPLLKKGATIMGHSRFHAKAILVDDNKGLVMTANVSNLGLDKGFETGIELGPDEVKVLGKILGNLKNECEYRLNNNLYVKDVIDNALIYSASSGSFREIAVKDSATVKLPEKLFASCQEMLTYSLDMKEDTVSLDSPTIAKSVVYRQLLKPPVLQKEAKPKEDSKAPFSLYTTGKGGKNTYIAVSTWEEVKMALEYAAKLNAKIVSQNDGVKTDAQSK